MTKPIIPAALAYSLRTFQRYSYPKIAALLKSKGYPEDPFPMFQPDSIAHAVRRYRHEHFNKD